MKIFEYKIGSKYSVQKHQNDNAFRYYENGIEMPRNTKFLYKYMSWNERTIASLFGNYLWLTNPVYFNDPFDCNKSMIYNYKFSEEEKPLKRNYYDNIGIVSFTEKKFCQLMWAHYTGNYNGIVLKFNSEKLNNLKNEDQFNKLELRKVIYSNQFSYLHEGFKFPEELKFFIKTQQWSYEKEWRYIANLKEPYNRFLRFNSEALEEIYIGHNLFENLNSRAIAILTQIRDNFYPHTKLIRVFPDSEVFGQIVFRSWDDELNK